jgi:hypothetical protein
MHSSVLQNKKYMKFASERTVEVIAVSSLDSGISKGDARAGTYKAKDENGKDVEYLVSWPGLTIDDMKKLRRSKAPGYNDTRGIPYVAIVNPHTLEKFAGWNGGSSGKIMEAVDEAQKALKKEYGKPVSRKDLMKVRKEENKVRKLLKAGDLGKAWTLYAGFDKKVSKKGKAFQELSKKLEADLLAASDKVLTELEAAAARGETKQVEKELRKLARPLKGTSLEERVNKLAEAVKPVES